MTNKIDELLSEKWMKKTRLEKKRRDEKVNEKQKEEEIERERLSNIRKYEKTGFNPNMEAFKISATETIEKCEYSRKLGSTIYVHPDYWVGGNVNPKHKKRYAPGSGYHSGGIGGSFHRVPWMLPVGRTKK